DPFPLYPAFPDSLGGRDAAEYYGSAAPPVALATCPPTLGREPRRFRCCSHSNFSVTCRCPSVILQWSRQKSGCDSAISSEFVIAGMIFHPSRVKSQLLHKYIEQAFVEVTLLPACHREDVWLRALLHAQILSAHQIERRQRGVEMKI